MTLAPGVLINQNVRLARVLGHGGMGAVWVADHLTLRIQVAVKFILAAYTSDEEVLDRFSREASSAAQIKSPHVVQVFDHGVFSGLPYIVMELLEGEDLAACIERGPLGLGELVPILQQIGKALTHAHALGIVHRDIKPANVYLTTAGEDLLVKLLDFGVAKMTRTDDASYRKTQTGQLVGTPCFMSPEQVFSRGSIDFRVDLWALAVLVYEAVVGALPFQGKTIGDVYLAINSAAYAPPTSVDRIFPPALDAWFKRAFAREPETRYRSAREMVEAFTAIAARSPGVRRATPGRASVEVSSMMITEPLGARHETFGGLVSTGSRRRRLRSRIALAAGTAGGLAALGVLVAVLSVRSPPATATVAIPTPPPAPSAFAAGSPIGASPPLVTASTSVPQPAEDTTGSPAVSLMDASAPTGPAPTASAPRHPKGAPRPILPPAPPPTPPPDTVLRHNHGF